MYFMYFCYIAYFSGISKTFLPIAGMCSVSLVLLVIPRRDARGLKVASRQIMQYFISQNTGRSEWQNFPFLNCYITLHQAGIKQQLFE